MQQTLINQEMDLTKVAALQQKRTLAFVNHFAITTVKFLNSFSKQCEQKLMQFERKIEKINATMVLLEARLSSIPEINTSETANVQENVSDDKNDNNNNQVDDLKDDSNEVMSAESTKLQEINPDYDRFVKMVHVGVPLEAVKLKLSLEGLDPKVLDQILGK